ncbi:MAG TPA: hypothetical protein VNW52_12510 [Burkholderiaceae bacterium]|jgi:hypothetical protein|nr:hypothetical protein [Burkholderiaceae bacterium]
MPIENMLSAQWQNLLATAEKNAAIIAHEVINDAVLGRSVTAAVSPYFAQADISAFLREEFAKADETCHRVRAKAVEVMRSFGLPQDWDLDDLKAADEDLWQELNSATAHAAGLNRKRAQAHAHKAELFANAIDVIDTCSGIATLRHLKEFRCEGDAFCTAYVAALSLADSMVGKAIKASGMRILSDFLQFLLGLKTPVRDCDMYAVSKTAVDVGNALGIVNTNALGIALMLAVKKNTKTPSQLQPHSHMSSDGHIAPHRESVSEV